MRSGYRPECDAARTQRHKAGVICQKSGPLPRRPGQNCVAAAHTYGKTGLLICQKYAPLPPLGLMPWWLR